jgi:hypothetical protein
LRPARRRCSPSTASSASGRAAIARMAYLFAAVEDTDAFVAQVRALQPAAG